MKKILPILTLIIFLLTFTKVSASLATDYPNVSGKQILIKTYLTADQAENEVPKLEVYANNGVNFDGIEDYGSCNPSANNYVGDDCGTPNKFDDKNVGDIKVDTSPFVSTITTTADKLLYNSSSNSSRTNYITKLSYVYHNDVWRSDSVDRNVYISKVEFVDAYDNQVLASYIANTYTNPTSSQNKKSYIYFDMGIVNNSGITDSSQNGMINAFDKVELRTIEQDNSITYGKWGLKTEGSLNINTYELAQKLIAKYPNGTSPNPTPNLEYDLNGDNKFDILDLVALIKGVFQ